MARDFEIEYERGLQAYDDAQDEADAQLTRMGLGAVVRPLIKGGDFDELPSMPPDLGELNHGQLTALLGRFTAWYGYALGRQADAQVQRNGSEEKRSVSWAKIRRLKDGTVADKDDAARIDTRYVSINASLFRDESVLTKVRVIVEGLKRNIETISRAIAALESRINIEGRGVAAARKQGSEAVQAVFHRAHRSALDPFKKRGK
jgi:hypothetical protein